MLGLPGTNKVFIFTSSVIICDHGRTVEERGIASTATWVAV